MKALVFSTSLFAILASAAVADNGPVSNRAQCYDLVISSCNANSSNPTACAVNGMNQCDEQFPRQARQPAQTLWLIDREGSGFGGSADGMGRGGRD